ncbi:hypothetical protein A3Q56_06928, partial [Intoshia linei]
MTFCDIHPRCPLKIVWSSNLIKKPVRFYKNYGNYYQIKFIELDMPNLLEYMIYQKNQNFKDCTLYLLHYDTNAMMDYFDLFSFFRNPIIFTLISHKYIYYNKQNSLSLTVSNREIAQIIGKFLISNKADNIATYRTVGFYESCLHQSLVNVVNSNKVPLLKIGYNILEGSNHYLENDGMKVLIVIIRQDSEKLLRTLETIDPNCEIVLIFTDSFSMNWRVTNTCRETYYVTTKYLDLHNSGQFHTINSNLFESILSSYCNISEKNMNNYHYFDKNILKIITSQYGEIYSKNMKIINYKRKRKMAQNIMVYDLKVAKFASKNSEMFRNYYCKPICLDHQEKVYDFRNVCYVCR